MIANVVRPSVCVSSLSSRLEHRRNLKFAPNDRWRRRFWWVELGFLDFGPLHILVAILVCMANVCTLIVFNETRDVDYRHDSEHFSKITRRITRSKWCPIFKAKLEAWPGNDLFIYTVIIFRKCIMAQVYQTKYQLN